MKALKLMMCGFSVVLATTVLAVENRSLGNATVVERVFAIDQEACMADWGNSLCYVKQYESTSVNLGVVLERSNPRCFYDLQQGEEVTKLYVAVDVDRKGYMVSVGTRSSGTSISSETAALYAKGCLDSLDRDAINVKVIAFPTP
jgi:hypothetical protein